ncbi:diguanylate cyclase (GGDEF) domain-containing protein [Acidovorax sp. CF316]|uniref:GGDEF domain-containing protein n=1 Tax=Acidovorax sp. CF316 TaxID=1144317 RepID=UPI00026BD07B|nr:GGDEF domain-containing protein [Acidovorax sp. CF316]EJE48922.1 diguanylate cyclase (GGDEF) domain-containing protein [Acidovorax sp. CF316]
MPLDFLTLMAVMAANLFMISATLPLIMGPGVSPAARHVQASMLLQATAWAAIIAAGSWWDQALSTVSVTCNALAQWMLYRALREWLGERPLKSLLLVLVVITPLGYALAFGNYAWRVGWANLLMAAILLIVARATLYPAHYADPRWRRLLMACLVTSAAFTLARGLLGAFTDQYPSFRTPHPVNLAAAVATNVSLVLGTVAVLVAWRSEAEQKLRALAMTDGLTGVLNRRGFTKQAENMLSHAWRHHLPLTALVLDLDYFKQINDTHGHETGDRALKLFARLLEETCRTGDLVGRLGGEEFGVLLLHNSAPAGIAFDRRLRTRLQDASAAELGFTLDYSAGMAVLLPAETRLPDLMARADAALYLAKAQGRGRMVEA